MATYSELQAQIADLTRQANEQRQEEMSAAVSQIQSLMGEHGITIDDLRAGMKKTGKKSDAAAKFKDPVSGSTWSGRGRKPHWLAGKDIESFRV